MEPFNCWYAKLNCLKQNCFTFNCLVWFGFNGISTFVGYLNWVQTNDFPQVPAGAWRILGGWRRSGWLWCCGRSRWWCSRRITKRSSPADSGRGRRGSSERRVQSRSTPSEAKPGSLWLVGRRWVLLPHPGSATSHQNGHREGEKTNKN